MSGTWKVTQPDPNQMGAELQVIGEGRYVRVTAVSPFGSTHVTFGREELQSLIRSLTRMLESEEEPPKTEEKYGDELMRDADMRWAEKGL